MLIQSNSFFSSHVFLCLVDYLRQNMFICKFLNMMILWLGLISSDFSQIQMTEIWPWFWWYIDEILVGYWQQLVYKWLIYDGYNHYVSVRYDLGSILARVRWGARIPKIFALKISPIYGRRGGGLIKFPFFSKIKLVNIILKGVGYQIMEFSTFWNEINCFSWTKIC